MNCWVAAILSHSADLRNNLDFHYHTRFDWVAGLVEPSKLEGFAGCNHCRHCCSKAVVGHQCTVLVRDLGEYDLPPIQSKEKVGFRRDDVDEQ